MDVSPLSVREHGDCDGGRESAGGDEVCVLWTCVLWGVRAFKAVGALGGGGGGGRG